MTLVASMNIKNHCLLFGDLLVSGDEKLDAEVHIPSIGDINNFSLKVRRVRY
jgi:hypothetical protein